MKIRSLILSFLFLILTETLAFAGVQCPGNATPLRYHVLRRSQIGVDVVINGQGPFEFMLDTGAQLTVMEPALVAELKLKPEGSIGVTTVANYSKAELVVPDLIQAGSVTVSKPLVAVHELGQIQASDPKVRGLLGENFLGRFDLLIDNGRKTVCFDETRQMQQVLAGERIELLTPAERQSSLPFTQPVLVKVHLPGDGPAGTILRVDSGSNAPLLFGSHSEILPWLQRATARRASVANGSLSLAVTPMQDVRIGTKTTRRIAFFTPINTGRKFAKAGEDGLLPTSLFGRVFISYADGFVMFDPR